MAVPLNWQSKVIGALIFRSKTSDSFGEREARVGMLIADQIAGAVANANLHEDPQSEAAERLILAEIGRIANSSLRLEDTYDALSKKIAELVPFDRLAIGTVDRDARTLQYNFVTGIGSDDTKKYRAAGQCDFGR